MRNTAETNFSDSLTSIRLPEAPPFERRFDQANQLNQTNSLHLDSLLDSEMPFDPVSLLDYLDLEDRLELGISDFCWEDE